MKPPIKPSPPTSPDKQLLKKHNARNALREAQERKREIDRANTGSAREKFGRGGLDPARFGDWEVKGIASDF